MKGETATWAGEKVQATPIGAACMGWNGEGSYSTFFIGLPQAQLPGF